eukprot:c24872_g1_i1 orf=220-1119(+)
MATPPAGGSSGPSRPTGCFKCGRPGHWSRDCPSDPSTSRHDTPTPPVKPSSATASAVSDGGKPPKHALPLPRKRPKLTPDLLLSNDGLGYVLEKLPQMVRIQGRGHEVEDLGSILEAYMHWHNRILPYFSFDQFVERVEKVGSMKRVRMCIHELRAKVAAGEKPKAAIGDTAKSNTLDKGDIDDCDFYLNGASQLDVPEREVGIMKDGDAFPTNAEDDIFDEFYAQATEEIQPSSNSVFHDAQPPPVPVADHLGALDTSASHLISYHPIKEMTKDQLARMEANRLKALERAKCRATVHS